jgi:hypothetical protein
MVQHPASHCTRLTLAPSSMVSKHFSWPSVQKIVNYILLLMSGPGVLTNTYFIRVTGTCPARTYFPNGISGGTKLAAHEQIGVFLVLHILLSMEAPIQLILNYKNNDMTRTKLNRWRAAFGFQLAWRAWIKRPSIGTEEVKPATDGHQCLMRFLNRYARRTANMQRRIIKFYMILHMAQNIIDLGVPSNIDTLPMEHNHIENAKKPSKGTQLCAYSIERQAAQRYYENLVVQHAYDVIGIPRDGVAVLQTNL